MNMRIVRGTIFGGIAFFLLGWLIYGIIMMGYNSAHTNLCMNRPDNEMIWWALILGNFVSALFLTLVLNWSGAKGILDGLKTGALFGFLMATSLGLGYWSMTTMYNSFGVLLVDIVQTTVMWALIGLVIVLLWGKDKTT
jgi:hypothetical protein